MLAGLVVLCEALKTSKGRLNFRLNVDVVQFTYLPPCDALGGFNANTFVSSNCGGVLKNNIEYFININVEQTLNHIDKLDDFQ